MKREWLKHGMMTLTRRLMDISQTGRATKIRGSVEFMKCRCLGKLGPARYRCLAECHPPNLRVPDGADGTDGHAAGLDELAGPGSVEGCTCRRPWNRPGSLLAEGDG